MMSIFTRKRFVWAFVAVVLSLHVAMLSYSAVHRAPTTLEPAFLVAGISHWEFSRYDLFRVNPPMVRMLAALPVLATKHVEDWSKYTEGPGVRPVFALGESFVDANGSHFFYLLTLSRLVCIPFSILGAVICFMWSREAWRSTMAGVASLVLWCCDPGILGHGCLITTDMAAASLGLTAGYVFWQWLRAPSMGRAIIVGVAMGLAQLSKMTWIVLFVVYPLIVVVVGYWESPHERKLWTRGAGCSFFLMYFLALGILNAGYSFDGTFTCLEKFHFVSKRFKGGDTADTGNRFASSVIGAIPVPLPHQYVLGLDVQQKDFEDFGRPSYLAGEWRAGGWWSYYIYGCAVKTPHGTQLLFLLAVLSVVRRFHNRFEGSVPEFRYVLTTVIALIVPVAVIFFVVSAQTEFNHHFRYVLPASGYLFVFAVAPLAQRCVQDSPRTAVRVGGGYNTTATMCISVLLVAYATASSSMNYPRSLKYFNEISGGDDGGARHLLHSSFNYGDGLWDLSEALRKMPAGWPIYYHFEFTLPLELTGTDSKALGESRWPPTEPSVLVLEETVAARSLGFEGSGRDIDRFLGNILKNCKYSVVSVHGFRILRVHP